MSMLSLLSKLTQEILIMKDFNLSRKYLSLCMQKLFVQEENKSKLFFNTNVNLITKSRSREFSRDYEGRFVTQTLKNLRFEDES